MKIARPGIRSRKRWASSSPSTSSIGRADAVIDQRVGQRLPEPQVSNSWA